MVRKFRIEKDCEYKYPHSTEWRVGTLKRITGRGSEKRYWVGTYEHGKLTAVVPFTGKEVRPHGARPVQATQQEGPETSDQHRDAQP